MSKRNILVIDDERTFTTLRADDIQGGSVMNSINATYASLSYNTDGGMTNAQLLRDAGYRIDFPGMTCGEHEGGRAYGLYNIKTYPDFVIGGKAIPDMVIPCSLTLDEAILKALDAITFPGGIEAWFRAYESVMGDWSK